MGVRCFWLDPTGSYARQRIVHCGACGNVDRTVVGVFIGEPETGYENMEWPEACPACGHAFEFHEDGDWSSAGTSRIYMRTDTGEEAQIGDFPEGAMWDSSWFPEQYAGSDGRRLTVRLPGGHDWLVDSRASNCSLPDDDVHKCWPRQGVPPDVTVDKSFGPTCDAGAGSIQIADGWHGFLRNGELVE